MILFRFDLSIESHPGVTENEIDNSLKEFNVDLKKLCELLGLSLEVNSFHRHHCDCDEVRQVYINGLHYKISRTLRNIRNYHFMAKIVEGYIELIFNNEDFNNLEYKYKLQLPNDK
ncbi:MAG: hypothetical protein PHP53_10640 [Prolixibacteraceae bacterium]|nr:hypothetical protein [Prolixibacteraceae bacterium]